MHSYKTSIHSYSYKTLPNITTKHSITFLQNTPIHSYKTSIHSYKTYIHSYKTFLCIPTKHSIAFLQNTPIHSYKTSIHSYKTYIHSYKTYIHSYKTLLCIPTKHLYIPTIHLHIFTNYSYAFLHLYIHIPTKHSQTFIQNTQGLWCCKRAGTEAPSHAQQVLQRYWHDCTGLLCSVEESQRVSVALYISVLRERERYIYMRNCDIIAIKRSTRLLYQCHNT